MSSWKKDKAATDPYLPYVRAICGAYLITDAPIEEDQSHNTDLIVLTIGNLRIAVRLRAPYVWKDCPRAWRHEFTIRFTRPNGTKTEFAKILEGWGDYFFYGFRTPSPPRLYGFGLMALGPLREWCYKFKHAHGEWPGVERDNGDRSSTFRCIRWDMVDPDAILVMYPKDIAIGNTLIPEKTKEAIQLTLGLFPGHTDTL